MSELRAIVDKHYAGMDSGDVEGLVSVLSEDVVTVMPGGPPLHGIEAFRPAAQAFIDAFPDARMVIRDTYETADAIIVEGSFVGTHTGALVGPNGTVPPTGKAIDLAYADIFRVRDGKCHYHAVYFDQASLMAQLGLMPEPAAS